MERFVCKYGGLGGVFERENLIFNISIMEKFKNIYEVRKSLRFELVPSKITNTFLEENNIYIKPINILYKNKLENNLNYSITIFENDLKNFIENIENIIFNLEKVKKLLDNIKFFEIFVNRNIFELIDKNFYIKYIKRKLSGGRSSSFYEIKKNLDWKGINLIKNYFLEKLDSINNLKLNIISIGYKESSFSKNEIKRFLKKISLEFIRIYNFLEKFDIKNNNFNHKLKEYITIIINFETFFNDIKSYYFINENQSSGILLRRFGFNEKSLNRRQPIEIKKELEEKLLSFKEKLNIKEKLNEEREKLIQEFDLKYKKEKFPELLHPEKWEEIRKKDIKTNEEKSFLEKINNSFSLLKGERNKNKKIIEITKKLNNYKKEVGNLKVQINNLEKELENNLALTHYSKLLEKEMDGEKLYYLVLIPIKNKNILENNIGNSGDIKILNYNTLTFSAIKKLALSYDGTMGIYWDKYENINKKTNIKKWIVDLYNDLEQGKRKNEFYKLKRYIINLLKTYSDIFGYIYFDFNKLYKTNSLDEFKIEFDKQGYNLNWKYIELSILEKLEKKGKIEIYQIYTKDFYKDPNFFEINYSIKEQKKERQRRRKEKNVNGNKNLFTIYWENFIQDINKGNREIRLNSDCGYFVKLKKEEEKQNHRFGRNKIIGNFGLIFNPSKKLTNKYDEKENIEKFNQIYKKTIKNIQNKVYIGLDRGVKELLTFCIINDKGECIRNNNGDYLIGNFNYLNSDGKFIKKEECFFGIYDNNKKEYRFLKNKDGKIESLVSGTYSNFLKTFVYSDKSIQKFRKNKNGEYESIGTGNIKFILTFGKERFNILDKNGNKIVLIDKNGKKVIDYSLLLKVEWYKRKLMNNNQDIKLEDIQEIRGGYISSVIKVLNKWIINYNGVIILENLGKLDKIKKENEGIETNKEGEILKKFGITIYQEFETLLNKKYNYFIYKDKNIGNLQLTPKVKNIGDINKIEKDNIDINLGNIIFINEENTSQSCPKCGKNLFGHLNKKELWESNMHHCDDPKNCPDIENHVSKDNSANCDYHMHKKPYGFDFINSGDDLASYNIAKKGLEYIQNI